MPTFPTIAYRCALAAVLALGTMTTVAAEGDVVSPEVVAARAQRLIAAYPTFLDRLEGGMLVFKDGTRMVFDDGRTGKSFDDLMKSPDIKDQFAFAYPAGHDATAPAQDFDPGRIRNEALFTKIYGDCEKHEVTPRLVQIEWLPKKKGGKLAVTTINGVADKLKAVSDELDQLPARFDKYLIPSAGVYNCRKIAGSTLRSVHSYGAAVDINADQADYWLWKKSGADGKIGYINRVPIEIVKIFERHGFIWGGRWYHFDTMHFEFRPELLPLESSASK